MWLSDAYDFHLLVRFGIIIYVVPVLLSRTATSETTERDPERETAGTETATALEPLAFASLSWLRYYTAFALDSEKSHR